jgi:hypothetical protein
VSNITGLCGLPKDRFADDVDLFRLATDFLVFRKETGLSIGVFEQVDIIGETVFRKPTKAGDIGHSSSQAKKDAAKASDS